MMTFTLTGEGLFSGISTEVSEGERVAGAGAGIKKDLRMSSEKPPMRHEQNPWMVVAASVNKTKAHGIILEEEVPGEKGILVLVRTFAKNPTREGTWNFLPGKQGSSVRKVSITKDHPEAPVFGWKEALVILQPGQGLQVHDQAGRDRTLILDVSGEIMDLAK
jgi:hypothetical protein